MPRKTKKSVQASSQNQNGAGFATSGSSTAIHSSHHKTIRQLDGTELLLNDDSEWYDAALSDSDLVSGGSDEEMTVPEVNAFAKMRDPGRLKRSKGGKVFKRDNDRFYDAKRVKKHRTKLGAQDRFVVRKEAAKGTRCIKSFFKTLSDSGSGSDSSSASGGSDSEDGIWEDEPIVESQAEILQAKYTTVRASLVEERGNQKVNSTKVDLARYTKVLALIAIADSLLDGNNIFKASDAVARMFYRKANKGGGKSAAAKTGAGARDRQYRHSAQKLRAAFHEFERSRTIITDNRGRSKGPSLIYDEDIKKLCRDVIKSTLETRFSAKQFQEAVSKELCGRGLLRKGRTKIGNSTATFWLSQLGMVLINEKIGIYKDGHERKDVVEFRERYVKEDVNKYRPNMITYAGDDMDEIVEAASGADLYREIFHDESIVASNDGKSTYYGVEGTQDKCYSKSQGSSIMVSGFICSCHGKMTLPLYEAVSAYKPTIGEMHGTNPRLNIVVGDVLIVVDKTVGGGMWLAEQYTSDVEPKLVEASHLKEYTVHTDDDDASAPDTFHHSKKMYPGTLSSFTWFRPGVNQQGWWTGKDVVAQAKEAERIFRLLHPGKIAIATFDNSTNHSCLPVGAKTVKNANKSPGGKNAPGSSVGKHATLPVPRMQNGWYIDSNGIKIVQSMHQTDGVFKGTAAILKERGVDTSKLRAKCTKKNRIADQRANAEACGPNDMCCCSNVLSNQPDFKAQKTALEELFTAKGHICRMLPKMHPELNPIESYWSMMKVNLRENCGYTIGELRKNTPSAIDSVPIASIRRHFRRANRFSSMYNDEAEAGVPMPFKIREYTMKKYSRHRQVPKGCLAEVDKDLAQKEVLYDGRKRKTDANEQKLANVKKLRRDLANYREEAADKALQALVAKTTTYFPSDSCP